MFISLLRKSLISLITVVGMILRWKYSIIFMKLTIWEIPNKKLGVVICNFKGFWCLNDAHWHPTLYHYNSSSHTCTLSLVNIDFSTHSGWIHENICLLSLGHQYKQLNLSMLRLLLSKTQEYKDFWKPSKPCHVGIHWIVFSEYSQMGTHVTRFQWCFKFFSPFCIG